MFTVLYQSINQSDRYSINIPGGARLNGETAESLSNDKILSAVQDINWPLGKLVLWTKGQIKEMCVQMYF